MVDMIITDEFDTFDKVRDTIGKYTRFGEETLVLETIPSLKAYVYRSRSKKGLGRIVEKCDVLEELSVNDES